MVMGSPVKRIVGECYYGLRDKDLVWHNKQPYRVMREATFEEWRDEQVAAGVTLSPAQLQAARAPSNFFYDISVD